MQKGGSDPATGNSMKSTIRMGQRFTRLVVLKYLYSSPTNRYFLCRCDCGTVKKFRVANMRSGATKSCGCWNRETLSTRGILHGRANTGDKTYQAWVACKKRCFYKKKKKGKDYKDYGARGITVCERWQGKNGFKNFLSDMGEAPKDRSLDRKNVNGHYEPGNCRWATPKEQANNKRKVKNK
jgi:hypothetical protein